MNTMKDRITTRITDQKKFKISKLMKQAAPKIDDDPPIITSTTTLW